MYNKYQYFLLFIYSLAPTIQIDNPYPKHLFFTYRNVSITKSHNQLFQGILCYFSILY